MRIEHFQERQYYFQKRHTAFKSKAKVRILTDHWRSWITCSWIIADIRVVVSWNHATYFSAVMTSKFWKVACRCSTTCPYSCTGRTSAIWPLPRTETVISDVQKWVVYLPQRYEVTRHSKNDVQYIFDKCGILYTLLFLLRCLCAKQNSWKFLSCSKYLYRISCS